MVLFLTQSNLAKIKIASLTPTSLKANESTTPIVVNMSMKNMLKKFWNWKIKIIREYPIWCAYAAWLEGIIIGLIIYHYFFMEKLSCCGVYG